MAKLDDKALHVMNSIRRLMEPLSEDEAVEVRGWFLTRFFRGEIQAFAIRVRPDGQLESSNLNELPEEMQPPEKEPS